MHLASEVLVDGSVVTTVPDGTASPMRTVRKKPKVVAEENGRSTLNSPAPKAKMTTRRKSSANASPLMSARGKKKGSSVAVGRQRGLCVVDEDDMGTTSASCGNECLSSSSSSLRLAAHLDGDAASVDESSDVNTSKESSSSCGGATTSESETPRLKRRAEDVLISSVGYNNFSSVHNHNAGMHPHTLHLAHGNSHGSSAAISQLQQHSLALHAQLSQSGNENNMGVVETYDDHMNAANLSGCSATDVGVSLGGEIIVAGTCENNSPCNSTEEEEEDDEGRDPDEYQFFTTDFDPFLFIYHLPPLQSHQVSGRSHCIPPKPHNAPKITLVLDLDETLVHCSTNSIPDAEVTFPVSYNSVDYTVFVRTRPHLRQFFEMVQDHFEIVIFTASHAVYADSLLNILDPERTWSRHRVFRDSCLHVEGNYLKELSVLGRDLSKVIIVDNSPHAFSYQLENGIPIESWIDDRNDRELLKLGKFLVNVKDLEDVRPHIKKSFKLRERVDHVAQSFGYTRPFYLNQ